MRAALWPRLAALGMAALLALLPPAVAEPATGAAEEAIRQALTDWMLAFNAGDTGSVCGLFAPELRYDYRGLPERGLGEVCGQLHGSLADRTRKYTYDLEIREIIVSGDLAAVRLIWTLNVKRPDQAVGTVSYEPGLDILRKQADGSWKIIRYLAYEE